MEGGAEQLAFLLSSSDVREKKLRFCHCFFFRKKTVLDENQFVDEGRDCRRRSKTAGGGG